MNKWYGNRAEEPIVIASRVQIRRNLEKYHFVSMMGVDECSAVAELLRGEAVKLPVMWESSRRLSVRRLWKILL